MDERTNSTYEVRLRAVNAVLRGRSMSDVANAFGTNRSTVGRWVSRFQEEGNDGLVRRLTSGRPRKLEELTEEELRNIVLQPASSFGYESDLWTVGRLHCVINQRFEVDVSKDTIWRRLREAGLTYQKPEREYYELDEQSRQEWLKKVVPKIRETVRKYNAILYFQDEANVSLTAFLGKTWSPCGQTPKAKVTGKRGGVAAMSAISQRGHLLFRLHNKRIASPEVIAFLNQMLVHHRSRHLVVVMDQAPPHTSGKTKDFIDGEKRLHVFHLPKYSPDWNPDDKVWNHLKHQELVRHQAKTKDELTNLTRRKLQSMAKRPRPNARNILPLLCCRTFRMSHSVAPNAKPIAELRSPVGNYRYTLTDPAILEEAHDGWIDLTIAIGDDLGSSMSSSGSWQIDFARINASGVVQER